MAAAPTDKLEHITHNCHEDVVSNMVIKKGCSGEDEIYASLGVQTSYFTGWEILMLTKIMISNQSDANK